MSDITIDSVATIVQPLVKHGLFDSPEKAVRKLTQDYLLHQIDHYRAIIQAMEVKHGMSYEQFEVYLQRRSTLLMTTPNAQLGQAILVDEEDAFEWKVAHEMLLSWLGLQSEIEQ